jgi:hypothetical protein
VVVKTRRCRVEESQLSADAPARLLTLTVVDHHKYVPSGYAAVGTGSAMRPLPSTDQELYEQRQTEKLEEALWRAVRDRPRPPRRPVEHTWKWDHNQVFETDAIAGVYRCTSCGQLKRKWPNGREELLDVFD